MDRDAPQELTIRRWKRTVFFAVVAPVAVGLIITVLNPWEWRAALKDTSPPLATSPAQQNQPGPHLVCKYEWSGAVQKYGKGLFDRPDKYSQSTLRISISNEGGYVLKNAWVSIQPMPALCDVYLSGVPEIQYRDANGEYRRIGSGIVEFSKPVRDLSLRIDSIPPSLIFPITLQLVYETKLPPTTVRILAGDDTRTLKIADMPVRASTASATAD